MVEHRLIERTIALMKAEVARIQVADELDPAFIDTTVDFIRVYADRTHYGKEEDILFHELAAKAMAPDHAAMMRDLVAEHRHARDLTDNLVRARNAYVTGGKDALGRVISLLMSLTDFYPRHMAMGNDQFFPVAMDYLDDGDRDAMLERFRDFDRVMIHMKYGSVVELLESIHPGTVHLRTPIGH
jgi:hemerythrin-like domain-containing protein